MVRVQTMKVFFGARGTPQKAMAVVTKRIEVLLLPVDEKRIEQAILDQFPGVKLLDNGEWSSVSEPPVRSSITKCGKFAAIWNPKVMPALTPTVRANGVIDGPQVGPVVQWIRCQARTPNILDAGRWAASNDTDHEPEMVGFVQAVWKILMRQTTNKLVRAGSLDFPPQRNVIERGFRVGPEALRRAQSGELVLASNSMRLLPE